MQLCLQTVGVTSAEPRGNNVTHLFATRCFYGERIYCAAEGLGKDNDAWALNIPGIAQMIMQGRKMNGWVRAAPEVYGDDALRRKLLKAALEFNQTLRKK